LAPDGVARLPEQRHQSIHVLDDRRGVSRTPAANSQVRGEHLAVGENVPGMIEP
jgi:hypothetical protein